MGVNCIDESPICVPDNAPRGTADSSVDGPAVPSSMNPSTTLPPASTVATNVYLRPAVTDKDPLNASRAVVPSASSTKPLSTNVPIDEPTGWYGEYDPETLSHTYPCTVLRRPVNGVHEGARQRLLRKRTSAGPVIANGMLAVASGRSYKSVPLVALLAHTPTM